MAPQIRYFSQRFDEIVNIFDPVSVNREIDQDIVPVHLERRHRHIFSRYVSYCINAIVIYLDKIIIRIINLNLERSIIFDWPLRYAYILRSRRDLNR